MQRIVGVEHCRERRSRRGVEVRLVGIFHTVDGVQRSDNLGARGVQRFVALALLFDEYQNFVGFRAQAPAADALNLAAPQPLGSQALADFVDVGSLRKAHIHVGAALEVDAVAKPVIEKD